MKDAKDFIPWKVTDISIRPYDGFWSMNPSIHYDGALWRCVLRCCDYAMPNGVTIRSKAGHRTGQQTKNAMVIFDPETWKPRHVYNMHERDDYPRVSTPHVGYEDMRIFKTDKGGLQGIAASLHLKRDQLSKNQPPEQVLLSFDDEYNIIAARPIRGDGWSGTPQKNWVPFDQCVEPRFLYSIDKGRLFGESGSVRDGEAVVRPSGRARPSAPVDRPSIILAPSPELRAEHEPERRDRDDRQASRFRHPDLRTRVRGGGDVLVRGKRMSLDAMSTRPSARPSRPIGRVGHIGNDSTRVMGMGRTLRPGYEGLRGGTQLVRVGDDAWLGIGHQMKFVKHLKYYWHTWYTVNSSGKLMRTSEPMKLAANGIEFAAGLVVDGDRVVVSFGVDDMECKIGETRLSAVMEILKPV